MSVNVSPTKIQVSASGTAVSATVSGGQGPQGPQGPVGVTAWSAITGKPSTFPPSAHTHTQIEVSSTLGNEDLSADLQEILALAANASNITQGTLSAARLPGTVVFTTDSRLTDAREWSASTVTQADAEAGTATARVAWTVQRVWQAIAAWWSASGIQATIDGKAAASHAHGNITTDGRVGTAASKILVTETGGTVGAADRVLGASQVFIDAAPGLPVVVRADGGIEEGLVPLTSVQTYFGYDSLYGDIDYIWVSLGGKASSTHASAHAADGSDPLSLSPSQIGPTLGGSADIGADISTLAALVTGRAAAVHTHAASDIVSGTISTARLPVATNAQQGIVRINTTGGGLAISSGVLSIGSSVAFISDSRFTDARNPLSHASSHVFGAADPVFVDAVQVATNTLTIQGATYASLNLALQIIDTAVTGKASKQLTTDALVGTTANRIVVTGAGGAVTTATIGSGLTLSGGTLTASGGGGGSSVGSDLYLWSAFR